MTREEEKNKARFEYVSKRLAIPDFPTYNAEYELEAAFDKGAKWAEEHPKQIEISVEDIEKAGREVIPENWEELQNRLWRMIERNFRAQFIAKACEWLERNYHATPSGGYYYLPEDCIEQFKQAMKGE